MSAFHELLRRFPGRASSFAPCLPRPAQEPPAGADWIHEIKHDGFRVMGRRNGQRVRLFGRNGRDLTYRFPLIASAVAALPVSTCLIDGQAIICDDNGLSIFDLIRNPRRGNTATLRAFDILELKSEDIRNWPIKIVRRCSRCYSNKRLIPASPTIGTLTSKARSFFTMPAGSAARASSQSGSVHHTAPDDQTTGSR